MENWKDIQGFEGKYQVSDLGRVKSLSRRKQCSLNSKELILKPTERQHGYLCVWLYNNNKGKAYSVHRLVAEAFCEKKTDCKEVNHINENKQDNRAENLEWVNRKQNANHGTRNQRIGNKNINGKKSKAIRQYTLNGEFIREYPSMAECNRITGFLQSSICFCLKRKDKHIAYGYVWEYATDI